MTITQLFKKYSESGICGAPIISNQELIELKDKLIEFAEFSKEMNFIYGSCLGYSETIDRILEARKNKY